MNLRSRIRVLLIDEHPVMREGLALVLGMQSDITVVGEAGDAPEAYALVARHRPDVVLTDVTLPGADVIKFSGRLREEWPETRVVIFARSTRVDEVRQVLRAGAQAYIQKGATRAELLEAIRAVHTGGRYLSAEVSRRLDEDDREDELSTRERQVLELVFKGLSSKDVGSALEISENTVNVHVRNILRKLGASSRTDAVNVALHKGILRVD